MLLREVQMLYAKKKTVFPVVENDSGLCILADFLHFLFLYLHIIILYGILCLNNVFKQQIEELHSEMELKKKDCHS